MKLSRNWQPEGSSSFPNLVEAVISNGIGTAAAKPALVQFFVHDEEGRRLRIEMTAEEVADLYRVSTGSAA